MAFHIFMLVCNLLVPIAMLVFGLLFEKRPPKKINYVYGYRTTRSMKNQDTWQFAHRFCGRLWKRLGGITLLIPLLFTIFTWKLDIEELGYASIALLFLQLVILFVSIVPTEKALKKTFDEYGRRRQ